MVVLLVGLYLAAIVVANLLVTHFGPIASIPIALGLIGFDLVSRDRLHDLWHVGRWWKMGLLIITGSILSYALNRASGRIALASCAAFSASALADTLVYAALHQRSWFLRSNGSNIVSAAIDSCLFIPLAFGGFPVLLVLAQFAAKVFGGLAWSVALGMRRRAFVSS